MAGADADADADAAPTCDREAELKQFDDTKAGVKGLVDAGVSTVPRIFRHPPEDLPRLSAAAAAADSDDQAALRVPVVDIGSIGCCRRRRAEAVDAVREAASRWGFFQLANHVVPSCVTDGLIGGVKGFHEEDAEVKKRFYSRERERKVKYASNFDLYQSAAANWRDTLTCVFDGSLDPADDLPQICR